MSNRPHTRSSCDARLGAITYVSASELANAMRRAELAHGGHEKRIGHRDENWPDWYAAYMVAEQDGAQLPT